MATRLADGIWVFDLGLFPPLKSNVYLIDEGLASEGEPTGAGTGSGNEDRGQAEADTGAVTLVDTGLPYNLPRLADDLADAGDGYEPTDLDRVLLTHYDLDHTGGLSRLREGGFDGPVYVGREDVDLAAGRWDPQWFHPKGVFHRAVRPFFGLPEDVQVVEDGDSVGGFVAYHTPGHNPGHTAYVHEGLGVAFLGDLVWSEHGELTPPFWLDSYDMHELRESIRSFAARTPAFELACPGHGRPLVEDGYGDLQRLVERL